MPPFSQRFCPMLVGLVLSTAMPVSAAEDAVEAESSYFDGLERYRSRDFVGAMDAFERALEQGPSPSLRERALQAFVRSALELSATDRDTACARIEPRGPAVERLSPADDAGRQALQDLQVLAARCAPPPPEAGLDSRGRPLPRPTPPTRPDYAPAISLSVSAGVSLISGAALYVLALDAVDERDAAGARFAAAEDEAARIAAARAVGSHEGRAETLGRGATVLLGAGGVLAALAVWAWAAPPETLDVPFALRAGPRWLGVGGVF